MTVDETLTEIARLVATLPGICTRHARDLSIYVETEADVALYGPTETAHHGDVEWLRARPIAGGLSLIVNGPMFRVRIRILATERVPA